MTTHSATITTDHLHRINAVGTFASTDPLTPVLAGVQLTVTTDTVTAIATDRYTIAEWEGERGELSGEIPAVTISAKTLTDVHKAVQRDKRDSLTITYDDERGTIVFEWLGGTRADAAVGGNYPPAARLYSGESVDISAGMCLDPVKLARLAKLTRPARKPADRLVAFAISQNGAGDPATKLLRADGDGYRVLIQPIRPTTR